MSGTSTPAALVALFALIAVVGACGGGARETGEAGGEYPLMTEPPPEYGRTITEPSGAEYATAAPPSVREVPPSPTCERQIATFHDGSKPAKRPIVVPPAPGLRAHALSDRRIRLEWSFESLPGDCRPVAVLLSITAHGEPRATPTTEQRSVDSTGGSATLTYPDFLPPPTVAGASAFMLDGRRSRTASVLIAR